MTPRSRSQLLIGILATLALTALSLAAVAVLAVPRTGGGFARAAARFPAWPEPSSTSPRPTWAVP